MKRLDRASRVLGLVVLAGMAASGCGKTLTMKYDDAWQRLIPVLSAGDEIKWEGLTNADVKWRANVSPCENADPASDRCTIKKGVANQLFSYKCLDSKPCDPEIAVDGGVVGVEGQKGAGSTPPPPPDVTVWASCVNGAHVLDTEGDLVVGHTVGWRLVGDISLAHWTATFEDQAAACVNTSPIEYPAGRCQLKAEGPFKYTFKTDGTKCPTPTNATLDVKPKK